MNPNRFFIPGIGSNLSMNPMTRVNPFVYRSGIFSKIFNNFKSFNWNGLLSGANKTLNVVNQAFPLIRQTKPMVSNIRNMVHLAKAFRSETTNTNNRQKSVIKDIYKNNLNENNNLNEKAINSNLPSFFI